MGNKFLFFLVIFSSLLEFGSSDVVADYARYTSTFVKLYSSAAGQKRSWQLFSQNSVKLQNLNSQSTSLSHSTHGYNQFSDMAPAEVAQMLCRFTPTEEIVPASSDAQADESVLANGDYPSSLDWSWTYGPIKDQGTCGSCWTYATAAVLESRFFLKSDTSVVLSEQHILDCVAGNYGCVYCNGCYGGDYVGGFNYAYQLSGIWEDIEYPYYGTKYTCPDLSKTHTRYGRPAAPYVSVPAYSDAAIIAALQSGPVAGAVCAGNYYFQSYTSGIMSNTQGCCTAIDHAITIVGYGTDDAGTGYWLCRNSWGEKWGLQGYFKVQRGANHCGIQSYVKYVNL